MTPTEQDNELDKIFNNLYIWDSSAEAAKWLCEQEQTLEANQ